MKSFGGHIERRFFDLHYTSDNGSISSDGMGSNSEPTSKKSTSSLTPGNIFRVADDSENRYQGSILQLGQFIFIIFESRIWNKCGKQKQSSMGSKHYKKIGQMQNLGFSPMNWFHEDMLKLRR